MEFQGDLSLIELYFYIKYMWKRNVYFKVFGQHFGKSICWGICTVDNRSNWGIYIMYFFYPLIVGEEGFRFIYFHFMSFCIVCCHSSILFLSSFWNPFVRSTFVLVKLLLPMNFIIFSWCMFWYMMITELPLSALEIMASLLSSFSFI